MNLDATQLLLDRLGSIDERLKEISESGSLRNKALWEAMDQVRSYMHALSGRLDRVEELLEEAQPTLAQVNEMALKASGAGSLGRALLWFCGALLSAALWLYAARDNVVGVVKWLAK